MQPTKFWKYVSAFLKNNSTSIQLCFDGTYIDDPDETAELLKLLLSTSTQPRHIWPSLGLCQFSSASLLLVSVNALGIQKAIKTKFVGLHNILGFIIKGCSTLWVSVLKYTFNFTVSQEHFPTQWMQAVIVPVYKIGSRPCQLHIFSINQNTTSFSAIDSLFLLYFTLE
jgi:hypothetical protein